MTTRTSLRHGMLRTAALAFLSVAVCLAIAGVAHACPGCKEALAANDPGHDNIVRGYFWSILFMMGMPFTILGCFGGYMYLLVRRSRAEKRAADEAGAASEIQTSAARPLEETVEV